MTVTSLANRPGSGFGTGGQAETHTLTLSGNDPIWIQNPFRGSLGFAVSLPESGTVSGTLELLAAYETQDGTNGTDPEADDIVDLGDLSQGQTSIATPAPIIGFRLASGTLNTKAYLTPYMT